jgi:hypothetical protein
MLRSGCEAPRPTASIDGRVEGCTMIARSGRERGSAALPADAVARLIPKTERPRVPFLRPSIAPAERWTGR